MGALTTLKSGNEGPEVGQPCREAPCPTSQNGRMLSSATQHIKYFYFYEPAAIMFESES
jgi:hypothetical protein